MNKSIHHDGARRSGVELHRQRWPRKMINGRPESMVTGDNRSNKSLPRSGKSPETTGLTNQCHGVASTGEDRLKTNPIDIMSIATSTGEDRHKQILLTTSR